MEEKDYKIIVKELGISIKVSTGTYYKIFNNEIGIIKDDGYEVSLETIKKYKKLYNSIRREQWKNK
jgi:hypothetical protein